MTKQQIAEMVMQYLVELFQDEHEDVNGGDLVELMADYARRWNDAR